MNITYIFRTPSKERSIERVFNPVMQYMSGHGHQVKSSFATNSRLWPLAMIYNMLRYAFGSYIHRDRIYHITGDVQYVACWMNPENTIMTIHDCVVLHNRNVAGWFKKLVYKLWYEKPLHRLHKVTCISEATRRDLIRFFPWAEAKLTVVPNSVGSEFQYSPREFNEGLPVILHVGTRSNKNLERVIEALDGIQCKLLIIGKLAHEQFVLLQKHSVNFENRFHISDEEIVCAYREADIISFPSLFEGFGMPIIEGQTTGRPVVTSRMEPMCSVAGEGALLVDPESVASIREGFLKLLTDRGCYDSVVRQGLLNAEKYKISAVAEGYEKIYEQYRSDC